MFWLGVSVEVSNCPGQGFIVNLLLLAESTAFL